MTPARISIITPCLNRAAFIADAVESVLAQGYPDLEHIVVDGGSTDGTLDVLARYPHLTVISEPDQGLYEAINKGLGKAGGEIVGHLNSDDLYAPGVLGPVAEAFARDEAVDLVSGGATVFERTPDGRTVTVRRYTRPDQVALSLANLTRGVPIINARFFRRRLCERVGPYDTRYRIAADRDFLLRVYLQQPAAVDLDIEVCRYRRHAASLSISQKSLVTSGTYEEHLAMAKRYFRDPDVPSRVRWACRRWHSHVAADGVVEALRAGRPGLAVTFARAGWRHDPWWPLECAGTAAWRVLRLPFKGRR